MLIEDDSLSRAWSRAFLHILDHPGTTITPLVLSLKGFTPSGEPIEDRAVRDALDACLMAGGKHDVESVASSIFPQRLWQFARGDRHRLFEIYTEAFPRYQAMNMAQNRRGMYFERLTSFGRGPVQGNQLEWIITEFRARPSLRRTALQAAIFDPERDHVRDAQLAFPCLQHVTFVPDGGTLTVNAFYATQQLFDKAYGNWLGLCRLGQFMAREMGLTFTRLNCFSGIEKLERVAKGAVILRPVEQAARIAVESGPLLLAAPRAG